MTGGADPAADFQAIETGMTEGHPCFVANNGRLGFGVARVPLRTPPRPAAPVQLGVARRAPHQRRLHVRRRARLPNLLDAELGAAAVARFDAELARPGPRPRRLLPDAGPPLAVGNKLTVTFAAEIAQQHWCASATGDDEYLAQQSIRTFFNTVARRSTTSRRRCPS